MSDTPDTAGRPGAEGTGGGPLAPRDAAALLAQATHRARRELEPYPPVMSLIRAGIALVVYGSVWLTVRTQHPYQGPTADDLLVVLPLAAVNVGAAVTLARRATAGVRGRTPLRTAEVAIMATAWVGVFVVMAALAGEGSSRTVIWGLYPVAAPLIVAGLAWAVICAARTDRLSAATALGAAAVGTASAFAGPVGAWAVAALGLCAVLVGRALIVLHHQKSGMISA